RSVRLLVVLSARRPPTSTLFPSRRSSDLRRYTSFLHLGAYPRRKRRAHSGRPSEARAMEGSVGKAKSVEEPVYENGTCPGKCGGDRKSTRLNSSHVKISYAVFCLKKKKTQ